MRTFRQLGIFAALLAAPAFAQEDSATELNKQLTNPVSSIWSLQLMGVTDHSEYVGVVQLANEPNSVLGKTPLGQKLIVHSAEDIQRIYLLLGTSMIDGKPYRELMTVYKLGDKHYAARSNEYELIPVPAQLGTEVQFNPPK